MAGLSLERIGFVNSETCRAHACGDVVGNPVAAGVAEGTRQAPRHSAVGADEDDRAVLLVEGSTQGGWR